LRGRARGNPAVTEKIFGPVATFESFASEEEAMDLARHPTYGLCAGVFTRDLSRAMRVTPRLEAGTVWINRYGRSRGLSCQSPSEIGSDRPVTCQGG